MDRLITIDDAADPRIAEFSQIRERDLTRDQNAFIAEGTVVLRMLAQAHTRKAGFAARKILLLKNRVEGLADLLDAFPTDVPVYVAEASVIDQIAGFHLHRGVLALGQRLDTDQSTFWDRLPQQALVLVGCGISNHDNMGAMFRNAAGLNADALLLDQTSCDPLYRKALRVSVGSVLSLPYYRGETASALLSALAERDFTIVTLSPRGQLDIRAITPTRRMALVVGTEGEGLPPDILARFTTAFIPQSPDLDSLNVATASGIALFTLASAMGRM